MFPHDGGTIPHSFHKRGRLWKTMFVFYKANFSLTIYEIPWCFQPGVFNQVWKYMIEFEPHRSAQNSSWPKKMQHTEIKWAKGIIANNIRQYICFTCFHCPKRKYLSIAYEVVCLFYNPSKQGFEEIKLVEKKVKFSLPNIHFNQENCCHLQAGGCFRGRQCFFTRNLVVKVGFFLTCVYCVLKCSIPIFFLQHDYWLHYFRQMLFLQRFHT